MTDPRGEVDPQMDAAERRESLQNEAGHRGGNDEPVLPGDVEDPQPIFGGGTQSGATPAVGVSDDETSDDDLEDVNDDVDATPVGEGVPQGDPNEWDVRRATDTGTDA